MDEFSANRFRNRRMKIPGDLRTPAPISFIVPEAQEKD
jgi:hypothetical protein